MSVFLRVIFGGLSGGIINITMVTKVIGNWLEQFLINVFVILIN